MDLDQIQIVAQLVENLDMNYRKLEEIYKNNNAEEFNKIKKEILIIQRKISEISGR